MQVRSTFLGFTSQRVWWYSLAILFIFSLTIFIAIYATYTNTYKGVYIISKTESHLILNKDTTGHYLVVNPEHLDNAKSYIDVFWPIDPNAGQTRRYYAEFRGHLSDLPTGTSGEKCRKVLFATHVVRLELIP